MKDVCPHNDKIVCDYIFRLDEFYRQMKLAFENGAKSFSYVCKPDVCPAQFKNCPRFLAAEQNQKQR